MPKVAAEGGAERKCGVSQARRVRPNSPNVSSGTSPRPLRTPGAPQLQTFYLYGAHCRKGVCWDRAVGHVGCAGQLGVVDWEGVGYNLERNTRLTPHPPPLPPFRSAPPPPPWPPTSPHAAPLQPPRPSEAPRGFVAARRRGRVRGPCGCPPGRPASRRARHCLGPCEC